MLNAEHQDFSEIDELDGLITPEVGRVLYDYALKVPPNRTIVELGSYHGKSTAYLALASRESNGPMIQAVDTWSEAHSEWRSAVMNRIPSPSLERFRQQLEHVGLYDRVLAHQGTSVDTAREYAESFADGTAAPIGLLYVDADHSYEAVMADFNAWRDLVAPDGIIIFDDYTRTNPGVLRALRQLRDTGRIRPLPVLAGRLVPAYVGTEPGDE